MLRAAYQTRIVFLGIAVAAGFILLVWRLKIVQIDRHYELHVKAQMKYTSSVKSYGVRGDIVDAVRVPGPNLLASSQVTYDVMAIPERMYSQREKVLKTLTKLLKVERKLLVSRFESGKKEVVVKKQVRPLMVNRLQQMKLPGLRYIESSVRIYPKNSLLCHVLGFISHDGKGVAGVEKIFDKQLFPQEGSKTFHRTRKAHKISYLDDRKALDGKNIHLTVMEPIQAIVEEEMDRLFHDPNIKPKACYAIMANPRTGAIMAISQRPNFNPNDRSTMKPENYNPRFLTDVFDPGSTMKAVSIAGALEYNPNLTLGSRYYCEKGLWHYGGFPLRDAGHYYEWLTIKEIIQKSSNIGTAKAALSINRHQYSLYKDFGFGSRTGINIGPESAGILWREKNWSKVSYTRLPIGQGISVTPLQMVQAYCALANYGCMMQLHVVNKVTDAKTGVEDKSFDFGPKVKDRKVISWETTMQMREALKAVTEDGGTAKQARYDEKGKMILKFPVAGKTGTAQKVVPTIRDEDGNIIQRSHYSNTLHVASFIGFVPADNPEFVLYIVVDEPRHVKPYYYGGIAAAPSFRRISEQTLNYLNISPKEGGE